MSKENNIITTPKGKANYCWLNRPDTTFNPDGTYQTNLILDPKDKKTKALCKQIKEAYEEAKIEFKKKNKKKKYAALPYFKNEDGDIEIKFSQKAKIKTKSGDVFEKTVNIYDSKKNPCKANIGQGTIMKVAFEIISYYHPKNGTGVTLRLKAVQIFELVEYTGSQDASDYGFEEEDGFEADGDDDNDDSDDDDEEEDEDDSEDDDEDDEDDSGEESSDDIPF